MRPKRLLIIGNFGAGNLGDDAILGGIVTDLKKVGYEGEIMVTHGPIASSLDIYNGLTRVPFVPTGLRSRLSRKKSHEAQKAFQAADMVIFGGGGLFVDAESWKAPYIWFRQARACQKWGIPYLVYGQSLGPLRHPWSRHWARKAMQGAKAIHVRDGASMELLQEWGLLHAVQGTDAALSYLATVPKAKKIGNHLVISLREWGSLKEKDWERLLLPIQDFAQSQELHPLLLSMDPGNPQEALKLKKIGFKLLVPSSAAQAYEMLSEARLVVSMRLHSSLFAVVAGSSLLVLAYSQKVHALFKALGLKRALILKPEEWKMEALEKALLQALEEKPRFNLEQAIAQNQDFLAEHLEL